MFGLSKISRKFWLMSTSLVLCLLRVFLHTECSKRDAAFAVTRELILCDIYVVKPAWIRMYQMSGSSTDLLSEPRMQCAGSGRILIHKREDVIHIVDLVVVLIGCQGQGPSQPGT